MQITSLHGDDAGNQGSLSDVQIFNHGPLRNKLENGTLGLPDIESLLSNYKQNNTREKSCDFLVASSRAPFVKCTIAHTANDCQCKNAINNTKSGFNYHDLQKYSIFFFQLLKDS